MAYQIDGPWRAGSSRLHRIEVAVKEATEGVHPWQPAVAGLVGAALGGATLGASLLPSPWGLIFVVGLLCPFAMMVAGDARRFLLGIIVLDIPLKLSVHLDRHAEAEALGALSGLDLSVTTIALLALYALWIANALSRRGPGAHASLRISMPLATYVVITALSMLFARDTTLAFFEVFLLLQSLLLYVYVASTVRTRQEVLFLVTMLLAGLVLESLIMLAPLVLGSGLSLGFLRIRADATSSGAGSFLRAAGTVGSPNGAAAYISMLLAPAAGILLSKLRGEYRVLAAVVLGLGSVALISTFSRGGWVGCAVSMAVLCLFAWRRGWLAPQVPLVLAAGAALLYLTFQGYVNARVGDVAAATGRLPLIELAFRMIQDRPLLGVGPNNFAVSINQYLTSDFVGAWLYTVHNKYLLVWAETGIGALAAFLLFLLTALHTGWRGWITRDRTLALIALGFTAAILGQMTHMMVDIFQDRPLVEVLWFAAALLTAIRNLQVDL